MAKRACRSGDWILHFSGLAVFTAVFASLYVLCAGVAFGITILEALLIDLTLFLGGAALWSAVRMGRWRSEQVRIAGHRQAGAAFARKTLDQPVMPAAAPYAKARTLSRPGLQPVSGFDGRAIYG